MQFALRNWWLAGALAVAAAGCAGSPDTLPFRQNPSPPMSAPTDAELADLPSVEALPLHREIRRLPPIESVEPRLDSSTQRGNVIPATHITTPEVRPVSHEPRYMLSPAETGEGMLTIDGRTYRLQLVETSQADGEALGTIPVTGIASLGQPPQPPQELLPEAPTAGSFPIEPVQLNLPTALSMVGGEHPAVGFAQWRVQEAYARLDQAQVLWLPSIQAGFSFHKHDGNYQSSNGDIVDVDRNSFQYGLGAGATGAGTTPVPGIVARFHLADAIFQPEIAEKTAWARQHAADGVLNEQLSSVALAYMELLDATQDVRIVEQTRDDTAALAKLTEDFAATGQGLRADADRLDTELILIQGRLLGGRERVEVASARLAQVLSLDADRQIIPLDPTVVPLDLVSPEYDKQTLISTGLATRPELKEAQSLVAVACQQYQRQKYAPLVPSVLLGFSNGGFGGGLGNRLDDIDGRYDFDAMMTWELRNLGFGERAQRRETAARVQTAKYETLRTMDQVAREIAEAHTQVTFRRERIEITKQAIGSAENSYQRNLSRIRDGQGLPLEVLQSVGALEEARRAYLRAVIEYNQAQFQLQWALGWPVSSPQ